MSSASLLPEDTPPFQPLADRARPAVIEDVAGQDHLLAPGKPLYEAITQGRLHSMIFWGPPGSGKTTLARLIASATDGQFLSLSAVLSGVKDIRNAVEQARLTLDGSGKSTILFVDEVHRFNKSQQDAFLPHIEAGTITLIGATTENPSFELNNALLSRARTYVLKALDSSALMSIMRRVLLLLNEGEEGKLTLPDDQLEQIAAYADGDARRALNLIEVASDLADSNQDNERSISEQTLEALTAEGMRRFDKGGEAFYDQISALHKSVRGSNPDASLYWLCRMLDGGCDPRYLARRIIRMASEDIGNADPRALQLTLAAADTYERLGSPEGELALAQAVVYLASAAKSNAVYSAYKRALKAIKETGSLEVPLKLRNAPTRLMKDLDYGKQYRYAHDEPDGYAAGEDYLPEALKNRHFYEPVPRGLEIKIGEKLKRLRKLDCEYRANKR
ncbi:MAG: recombination factor protein RarA [Thiothrix sp.]|nr:MAG: recombination factor protein RarA [Thiothrix sp.]